MKKKLKEAGVSSRLNAYYIPSLHTNTYLDTLIISITSLALLLFFV